MNKEHLLQAISTALGVDAHVHHEVKGLDKSKLKREIRKLKLERDKALEAHDHDKLKKVRRQIKVYKNQLRRAMV